MCKARVTLLDTARTGKQGTGWPDLNMAFRSQVCIKAKARVPGTCDREWHGSQRLCHLSSAYTRPSLLQAQALGSGESRVITQVPALMGSVPSAGSHLHPGSGWSCPPTVTSLPPGATACLTISDLLLGAKGGSEPQMGALAAGRRKVQRGDSQSNA